MMKSARIAVIDVGSNTVKLLVAERDAGGRPVAVLQRTKARVDRPARPGGGGGGEQAEA